MLRRASAFVLLLAVVTAPLVGRANALGASLLSDGFEGYPVQVAWPDGSLHGLWTAVYNGYGTTNVVSDASAGSKTLQEKPNASTSPGETHAGLVTSVARFGDMDATVRYKTVQQLRTPTPNKWEVGWVLWHHTDDTHFYYFVAKPNGWELGKEDPAYPGAQRYLATGSNVTFPIHTWYTVRVRQVASTITVWVNGTQIVSFTDTQRPYTLGSVGLYNEDSQVRFDSVTVNAP